MSGSHFLLPFQRQRSLSAITIDALALGSRILPILNASARPLMHRTGNPGITQNCSATNHPVSKTIVDSEYYNCDYIGLKQVI